MESCQKDKIHDLVTGVDNPTLTAAGFLHFRARAAAAGKVPVHFFEACPPRSLAVRRRAIT